MHLAFETWFLPRVFLQHNLGYKEFGINAWGECWGLKMNFNTTFTIIILFWWSHQYFRLLANNWLIFCWGFEQPGQVQYCLPPWLPEIWSQPQTWPPLRPNGGWVVWRWGQIWIPSWKRPLVCSTFQFIYWCFAGLPANWTDPTPGAVSHRVFDAMFPGARTTKDFFWCRVRWICQIAHCASCFCTSFRQDGKLPVMSLFTGIAGLEIGLHPCFPQENVSVC